FRGKVTGCRVKPGMTGRERAVPVAGRNVGGQHGDAVALAVLDQLRGRIETHGLRIEHGRQESLGLVALEPATLVSDQREAVGVAFRKAVFAEALDLPEDALGVFRVVALALHALHDALVEAPHAALALPRRHRTA